MKSLIFIIFEDGHDKKYPNKKYGFDYRHNKKAFSYYDGFMHIIGEQEKQIQFTEYSKISTSLSAI